MEACRLLKATLVIRKLEVFLLSKDPGRRMFWPEVMTLYSPGWPHLHSWRNLEWKISLFLFSNLTFIPCPCNYTLALYVSSVFSALVWVRKLSSSCWNTCHHPFSLVMLIYQKLSVIIFKTHISLISHWYLYRVLISTFSFATALLREETPLDLETAKDICLMTRSTSSSV